MRELKLRRLEYPAAADTPHFAFQSDGTSAGDQAVAEMQAVCEADYATLKGIFNAGDIPGLPCQVIVDPGAGGAYHQTCQDTTIHLIPDDAPSLLVAEVAECFMAMLPGWDCGRTNGEGLSRALAEVVRPFKVLAGIDGDTDGWWNGGQPHDFVNDNSASDQDQQANACGTLFLLYLRSQLGYTWQQIAAAGASTLGGTYQTLTGMSGTRGFGDCVAALRPIADSSGHLAIPASGNPFPTGPAQFAK